MVFEQCAEIIEAGNVTEILEQCPFAQGFTGGMVGGALVAVGIIIALILGAALYVYFALAWYTTAKKLKYKYPWLAWIPIANIALILQLGGFHWAWAFLILIPVLGWATLFILAIISKWRIFEKRKYPGWLSLAIILPQIGGLLHMIVLGFVAWGKGRKNR